MFYDHDTVWQDPIATVRHDAATTTVDLDFMALAARQRSLEAERRRAESAGAIVAEGERLFGAPASGSPYLVLVRSPFELS